mmetsp:Transcript_18048/g.22099  ORF Transcript_18048/g.22099 Transcript_18048/m.22099 type:complete len:1366 (+) Transcript_18048:144-4241(+)
MGVGQTSFEMEVEKSIQVSDAKSLQPECQASDSSKSVSSPITEEKKVEKIPQRKTAINSDRPKIDISKVSNGTSVTQLRDNTISDNVQTLSQALQIHSQAIDDNGATTSKQVNQHSKNADNSDVKGGGKISIEKSLEQATPSSINSKRSREENKSVLEKLSPYTSDNSLSGSEPPLKVSRKESSNPNQDFRKVNITSSPMMEDSPSREASDSSQDHVKVYGNVDDSSDDESQVQLQRHSETNDISITDGNSLMSSSNGSRNGSINGSQAQRIAPETNNDSHHIENNEGFEMPECDAYFLTLVNLDPIPESDPLPILLPREVAQVEHALQIGPKYKDMSDDYTWRDDWNGNLQLIDKDLIMNVDAVAKNPHAKQINLPFCEWVAKFAKHSDDFICVRYLFSYVYNMKGTPAMAKRILAYFLQRPATSISERLKFIIEASKRISYDPIVLTQDGWTTAKSDTPEGATGGAYLIGRKILWQRTEAIIIAFVRDEGLGDLWKCMWIEDFDTFDLEADELQEGMKRWERKVTRKQSNKPGKVQKTISSTRFEQSRNFTVNGADDGIILATSYKAKGGRPWPARIMHVKEVKAMGHLSTRRSSSKNEIHVVFLAPYWNGQSTKTTNAKSSFATGSLFELETIDVSNETIQEYPYDGKLGTLSVDKLRSQFSFLGLPRAAFSRYLQSHRIALSLKAYANSEKARNVKSLDIQSGHVEAYASLTDTHPLSVTTYAFPDALLNLPFDFILSKYPPVTEHVFNDDSAESTEPILQLKLMLNALIPPRCFGEQSDEEKESNKVPSPIHDLTHTKSPEKTDISMRAVSLNQGISFTLKNFCSDYLITQFDAVAIPIRTIKNKLEDLVNNLNNCIVQVESEANPKGRQGILRNFLLYCIITKGQGEDALYGPGFPQDFSRRTFFNEWRKACERIYKRAIVRMGHINAGNNITAVLTDSRCNQHITATGSFERAVRLPAAIRGAKNAGAGAKQSMPLVNTIDESFLELAEQRIIPMAHKASYINRLKKKIAALPQDAKGVPLTDDSEGEGGEDTMGSRGSYTAAVTGVAAAIKGVDMIIKGDCVNGFCAIRPPGHHAGRELRPMSAVSNGFCLLNAAACAALYAASPLSEGGLGLRRVCVVDIDVHHGNGTQDVLCSTYDPRFLYISTHAGGPHINGYDEDSSTDGAHRSLSTKDGIFPGRCGDTSPHKGVLNIPLGQKITPSEIGTALVCQVTPAIEAFSPELIIISAGFDAHKNDPLGLGGLSAEDFGTVTKVICQVAIKMCSGRVLSILEGGYGVPCCRPLDKDLFLPNGGDDNSGMQPKLFKLGNDLPDSMEDPVGLLLSQKLDKCHQEGFKDCVQEHVKNLALFSDLEPSQPVG